MTSTGPSLTLRRLIVLIAALLLAVWVARMSLALTMTRKNPALALIMNPHSSRASAATAELLAKPDADASTLARATTLARASVMRDGTTAAGIRTLGLIADLDGDRKRATMLFRYAALTSSRDLPAQLWLIQEAVERDDTRGALGHFDLALRSSFKSANLLFPVLVGATEDDRLLEPIAEVLARRPWWGNGYLVNLVSNGKATTNILAIFKRLDARGVATGAEPTTLLINRLVQENRFREARAVFGRMFPKSAADVLQNGSFTREPSGLPFDWALTDTQDLRGERGTGDDGTIILRVHAAPGASGTVARQLVVLDPGRYRVSVMSKNRVDGPSSILGIDITCAGTATRPTFAEQVLDSGVPRVAARASFAVPEKNCPAVWVAVTVTAHDEESAHESEISRIALVTLRHD